MLRYVTYRSRELCVYRNQEKLMETSINAGLSLVIGVVALTMEVSVRAQVIMLAYSIGSLLYAVKTLPSTIMVLKWAKTRPDGEMAEVRVLDTGMLEVNGFEYEMQFRGSEDIELDCSEGIAYVPTRVMAAAKAL